MRRDSFFSRNSDTILTKANITTKLNDLGNTDTKYVKAVAENFVLFKKAFEKYVQNDLNSKKLDEGILAIYDPQWMLAITDKSGKATLPDELLFAMMLELMHWSGINKNLSRILPRHVIALLLYGDSKAKRRVTPRQHKTFKDMGPTLKNVAHDLGRGIFDSINVAANRERESELAEILRIQQKSPALKGTIIIDPVIADRTAMALGLSLIHI